MIDIPPLKKKNAVPEPDSLSAALGWDRFMAGDTETFKATTMKKEADGMHPASHYLVVVDPKKPSTWHLRVRNVKGSLDTRLLGAAQAALTVGYRGNKYQGPNKGEALVKLRMLRKKIGLATKKRYSNKQSSITVFKDKNGEYWWVALSSNAYRDRDGEIVSQKALANDVKRADHDGDYGTLRFWHMPGVDIGDAKFNMLHGRTLIEAGKFRDPQIAHAVAQKAHDYQVSIGFRHPTTEPDNKGIFHNIHRFERSLVPSGRASNPFTSLSVTKKENQMTDEEKVKAFKALLEDDRFANALLAQAETNEKQAEAMGVAFKEADLSNLTADELLEYAIAKKEHELAEAETEKANEEGEEEMEDYKMGDYMKGLSKKMDDYSMKMDAMHKLLERMGKKPEVTTKDSSLAETADIHTQRIIGLEAKVAQLTQTVKDLTSLPQGVLSGYRPTQDNENVTNERPKVEKSHSNGQATAVDGFLDFVTGGV